MKRARPKTGSLLHAPLLQRGDVRGLQALGPLGHFELDGLAFIQRLIPVRHDRREMHENVFAGLALDESKTLACIEPLNGSLFFQLCISFLFKLFGATSHCPQSKKRGAANVDSQPLKSLKDSQEQQTHLHDLMLTLHCPFNSPVCVPRPFSSVHNSWSI